MAKDRKIAVRIAGIFPLLLISLINANGQYTVDLPQFIPASPEPTAFIKAGVGNTNMATGAATASIPLYTIKVKDFTFPISLSYSTQGLKADEASSRVGFGWTISNTAMISRTVRGEPDEFSARQPRPADFNPAIDNDALYSYLDRVAPVGSGQDTQPDEFQFSCNGYSGKFVLDSLYHALVTSTSNIKIVVNMLPPGSSGNISTIVMTAPDGVIYTFGSNFEKTLDHNNAKYSPYKLIKTAFFLDGIVLPTGESIAFNYTSINNVNVTTGQTQTLQISNDVGQCGTCAAYNSYSTTPDRVTYVTSTPSSITTSTGITINFSYGSRADTGGDKRLIAMDVVGLKTYNFEYYDLPGQATVQTGRFFLTKVHDVTLSPSLDYVFTYEQMSSVPLPITFQQDYLGYYNSSVMSYFIPPSLNSQGTIDFSFRNPNWLYSKLGTLTKVQYPTGGTEEFVYEANTTSQAIPRNTLAYYTLLGPGGGSAGSYQMLTYSNNAVTVPFDQVVTLDVSATMNNGNNSDANVHTVSVYIYEGANTIVSRSVVGYNSASATCTLIAGHTYQLSMQVVGYPEVGSSTITYNTSPQVIYDTLNIEAPGVRVKQIKDTDPVTGSTHSKYYTYATLSHLTQSTGNIPTQVNFHSGSIAKYFCNGVQQSETDCNLSVYSSSSTGVVYSNAGSGSVIYYNTVIESDDPAFVNGGTEYTFFTNDNGAGFSSVFGSGIPSLPAGQYPTLSGVVSQTRMFNSAKQIVTVEQNVYETLSFSTPTTTIYVRKNFSPVSNLTRPGAYDAAMAFFGGTWNRLKTRTLTNYTTAGGAQSQQTTYAYGTPTNILPASTTTIDSKGNTISSNMQYPNTYSGGGAATAGYLALTTKNILTPVVLQASYNNGTLLQQKQILYRDWLNNGTIVTPEHIQLMESSSDVLHDVLVFNQYSSFGNPVQLQKANDISIVYLWDETLSLPIAEIKNVSSGQVAFTSFENGALGNWVITSGSPASSTKGFTGSKSLTGTVSCPVTSGLNYQVTLWTTGSNPTVNSAAGTLVKSVNVWNSNQWTAWNLYQWTTGNNITAIAVSSGTGAMDEMRVCPVGSIMQTFSYKPFVGVVATVDNNNAVTYYSYDRLGRLSLVRDFDGNILKQYEYQYQH